MMKGEEQLGMTRMQLAIRNYELRMEKRQWQGDEWKLRAVALRE
jgi:hypothetical protein